MLQNVKFFSGEEIPLEMHKVRIVQKLNLVPVERRMDAIKEAGYNLYKLSTNDIFLDMITDSGVNAMSDNQLSAMMRADDSYAGSQSWERFIRAAEDVLGKKYFLPVHQGRAAENILARTFVKKGNTVITNYHFTTTLAHIMEMGGNMEELICKEAFELKSSNPFKGNMDIDRMDDAVMRIKPENIPFVRMEASTNLIGGQPFSIDNLNQVRKLCDKYGLMLVLDASLLGENAYLIKEREKEWKGKSLGQIIKKITSLADIIYFSARKLTSSKGGCICTNRHDFYLKMEPQIPLFEGFLTYGGMSVREIEAMAVGIYETLDETVIGQSVSFIKYLVENAEKVGIPMVTPPGVLGAHVDALRFCEHIPRKEYPAGAIAVAMYICSGIRGMERGTMSSIRDDKGEDIPADLELLRLAFPRRVFTLSQTKYVLDRLSWLYENRKLIGGLKFNYEPRLLRFFTGTMLPVSDWTVKIINKFRKDFGDSL